MSQRPDNIIVPDVHEPQPGEVIADKYQLKHLIGRGGFGLVYDALRFQNQQRVALKLLLARWARKDPEIAIRFRREAVLASQLRHSNTITLYDYGSTPDGMLYMAMEYVEGRTLSLVLRDESPLAPERVRHILVQILGSLQEAHQLGIIHRDLKPGNIMITPRPGFPEAVKVLDFGIAKAISPELLDGQEGISGTLTQAGQFCGTPRYMAPEQFRGGGVTPACDLYSLGLIAYEMLTGEPALKGDTMVDLIVQQVAGPSLRLPEHVQAPDALRAIIHKALQKKPEERWNDAASFRQALLGQGPIQALGAGDLLDDLSDADNTVELDADKARQRLQQLRAQHYPQEARPTQPQLRSVPSPHHTEAMLDTPLDHELDPTELRDPFLGDLDPDTFDQTQPGAHEDPEEQTLPHDFSALEENPEVEVFMGGAASQDGPLVAHDASDDAATTEMVRDHFADDPLDNAPTLDISRSELFQDGLQQDAVPATVPLRRPLKPLPPLPRLPNPDETVDISAPVPQGDRKAPRFSPRMQAQRVTTAEPSKMLATHNEATGRPGAGPMASALRGGWTPASMLTAGVLLAVLVSAVGVGAYMIWQYQARPAPGPKVITFAPQSTVERHEKLSNSELPPITIRIESQPSRADVIIQGEVVGQTPIELVRSKNSQENVRIRKEDYLELVTALQFSQDQMLPVVLTPKP